mgnify:CR=1 FL=1
MWYRTRDIAFASGSVKAPFSLSQMTFPPFFPAGYGIGLGGVYLAWLLVLAILYPPCKAMADLKSRRKDWWLSYL